MQIETFSSGVHRPMTKVTNGSQVIRMCDNCKKLGATMKSKHYGSVFNWCSLDCFDEYLHKSTKGNSG